ncbi:hypothetical protein [Consotaella salsifontis]|uniref:hypothetical protein n=1 Tax=Consotaella salsifontis TaxID=1365950 RepID=UPI000999D207|nr:hypothetical protein [Consotaella salsifontis]
MKFAKSSRTPVNLTYFDQKLAQSQERLANRLAMVPQIDLGDFHRRAVIDWVDIGFWISRRTQAIHVKRTIDKALDTNCFTDLVPLDEEEKRSQTGTYFSVILQEPTIALMLTAVGAMEQKFSLEMQGVIRAMEISVDFRPRTPSPDARTRMLTVLQRHHVPPPEVLSTRPDRPRFAWGNKMDGERYAAVLPLSRDNSLNEHLAITTDHDRQPVGDANYYVGRKYGPAMWRIMDKEIDQQNRAAGTARILTEEERRVRMEVTLETEEVRRLGVIFIDDLRRFHFEGLQNTYFRFMLPTFKCSHGGVMGLVSERLENDRRRKFMMTGMIGLREMDDALQRRRATHRRGLIKHLRERGLAVKPEKRAGRGPSKTYVAYNDLNKAFEVALRNLREREQRELQHL